MESLVERSGMAYFWPLNREKVKSLVSEALGVPERDRWIELKLSPFASKFILPRKKVCDFDDYTMNRAWTYGRLHLTYATTISGPHHLVNGYRQGGNSNYLDEKWTGAIMFLKVQAA